MQGKVDLKSQYLSIKEVAKILRVHEMTVYRHVNMGLLPARKVGKLWRIPADAVTMQKTK